VVHSTPLSEISMQRFLSVLAPVPMRQRWLESGKALALREPLAAPLTFAATFCERQEKFPPSAANAKEFRAHARPQPSQDNHPLSDLPVGFHVTHPSPNPQARSDKRACLRTVGVALGRETPQRWPRNAATPTCCLQNAAAIFNRAASGARSADGSTYSSKGPPIGKEMATDKNPIKKLGSENG